jgi:hypothetical protein
MERGYIVESQIQDTAAPAAARHPLDAFEVHLRLKVLEARAMRLLVQVATDPRRENLRRSLTSFEGAIATLRAELAWRRVEPGIGERL